MTTEIFTQTAYENICNLQQGHSEPVELFYPRFIEAVNQLQALVLPVAFPCPDSKKPDADEALVHHGATAAFNNVAFHLFISNLRPLLRQEILKSSPTSLSDTFQKAKEVEGFRAKDDKQKKDDSNLKLIIVRCIL